MIRQADAGGGEADEEVVQAALENVRRVSQRLHPNVLDDYGLEGAVEWYSNFYWKRVWA